MAIVPPLRVTYRTAMKWAWAAVILAGIAVVFAPGFGGVGAHAPASGRAKLISASTDSDPRCHPSYQGACVPMTSDVDCVGGRGNGPAFVGRVEVVGPDVYGLDRDGDGIGCE